MYEHEQNQNEITKIGLLDLRGVKSPLDLKGMKISKIGLVLVSEGMFGYLSEINALKVGAIVPVPNEVKVTVLTGTISLTQGILEAGAEDTILIIEGAAIISTQIEKIGYKELRISGVLVAPKGSEPIILPKLAHMSGEMIFYTGTLQMASGIVSWNRAFLEMLPDATTYLLSNCQLVIDDNITDDLLKSKIGEIMLYGGVITAPPALLPILQTLAVIKMGMIQAKA